MCGVGRPSTVMYGYDILSHFLTEEECEGDLSWNRKSELMVGWWVSFQQHIYSVDAATMWPSDTWFQHKWQTSQATVFMHFFNISVFHIHNKYIKLFLLMIQP